ncbi:uroporphyrinogen-III synthase [Cellulomonas taurus]|uniref:uroporphyrinogen-III synthase n=1 Tax=Cellulomonas taurus TaxID=2729175 RepID=UPI00145DF1D8|nr:uroporphyrinogen-III synthase [Cellulomonas taurus]
MPETGLVPAPQGPLTGLRVLVPRETEGPDPLVIALLAAGAEPVVVPLIQTVPPEDPTELDDTLLAVQAGYYGWVGVTSAAAVPVLEDRAEETGTPLVDLLADVRVAAVGGSTARALRSVGVRVDVVPTGQSSARTLLRAWPPVDSQPEPRRVLLPLGDLAADTLAEGLRSHGWAVDVVTTYRTVPGPMPEPETRQEWAAGAIDAVLLTSGSTARNLVDLLGPVPDGVHLICIGDSTAAEALRAGLRVSAVAVEQSPSGLVAALIATVTGALS